MTKKLIIGFCGYSRSGKDTATRLLLDSINIPLIKEQFAFADALRAMAGSLNVYFPEVGMRYNDVVAEYGYEVAKTKFPCVREHLVAIGHGGRNVIKPSIWIDAVADKIERSMAQMAIISDVRYLNEVNFILNNNGIVIYLERPDVHPANETEARSIKEILATETLKVVYNDLDLETLEGHLVQIIREIL